MNTIDTKPIGLLKRFFIMFYDAILLIALLFFASIIVAVPLDITRQHPLYPAYIFYIYLVAYIYFGWCWTHGGQTLGTKTWKIKLVADAGDNITWTQSLLRYIGSLLCWASLGIGFLWCYTNKERRAWNDMLSKTHLTKAIE
jgi:uncharacterized RDD family membrane protein YckC